MLPGGHSVPVHAERGDDGDDGWGWLGEALSEEERDGVARLLEGLDRELGRGLAGLLSAAKIETLAERCTQLLDDGIFSTPSRLTLAAPWPLL